MSDSNTVVQMPVNQSFPFRHVHLADASSLALLPLESLLISAIYIANTLACVFVARRLPASKTVNFFARNTLIIFIAHMPLIFELSGWFYGLFASQFVAKLVWVVVIFVGLAVVSELMQRAIPLRALRDALRGWVFVRNS